MSNDNVALLKKVQAALSELGSTLDDQNDSPNTAHLAGVSPQTNRVVDPSDRYALREELRKKSTAELQAMFGIQARKQGTGIPFEAWAGAGGNPTMSAIAQDPILAKALDSSGASALIRQDLEPILYELYIREFPAWERFRKEPANGLVHAYNRITSFGDAQFMTELGTVTDDLSTYERQTAPISVIATRRGISLRSQFAVQAGGMGYNPEQLELQGGLRAIAYKMQKTIFQGNASVSSGTASTEDGAYDVNSFNGLRTLLKSASYSTDCDPTGATPDNIREKINDRAVQIMQSAGRVNVIYVDPVTKAQFDIQQDANVRYMNNFVNVTPGVLTNAVNTVFGPLPLAVVPGDAIGMYTKTGTDYRDMYLLDEDVVSIPYLGSDGPTVLDIPIGISGQLTHLYIIFGMWGMAMKALQFNGKVRVAQP